MLCAFCSFFRLIVRGVFAREAELLLKAEGIKCEFIDFVTDMFAGERRRKRRPGAISAPCGAPTEPRASRPSVRPLARLLRAFALRRGYAALHTRRAVPTSHGGTPRPALLSPRLCSRVPSPLCGERVPPGRRPSIVLRFTADDKRRRNREMLAASVFGEHLKGADS